MYEFSNNFKEQSINFLNKAMMGPNAMRIAEEMASYLNFSDEMRVLDLGCGMGISTALLVRKFKAIVFACDLWINPTENYERFKELRIDKRAFPFSVDATKCLPFAERYFDLLFSVDAYHYFGDDYQMLPSLIPYVKRGGYIAIAVPGIKYEFGENIPAEMKEFWIPEVARTIHSVEWWTNIWSKAEGIDIISIKEMECCDVAWKEWHSGDYPDLEWDIKMKEAENGKYYNFIQMIAKVI